MRTLFVWVLALAASGCDPRLYESATPAPAEQSAKSEEPPAPAPGPFGLLRALSKRHEPGPFEEPEHSPGADQGPYVAVLELHGQLVELEAPFTVSLGALAGGSSVTLRKAVARLAKLDADDHVKAIVLRLGDLDMSLAAAEELRAAVAARKKPVLCHAQRLSNDSMLLASACRVLALEPGGEVMLNGPSLLPLYLKGLLDLLSVQADFLHVGAYKGAAEPLMRTGPSPEMRQTYEDLVAGAYDRLVELVAAGRHVPRAKAVAWIDQGLFDAEAARAAGLVDAVEPFAALRASAGSTWKRVRVRERAAGLNDVMRALGLTPPPRVHGPHVALLYGVGEVVEGRGGYTAPFEEIASGRLAPAVRAAAAADNVKAIVLRIDSPGGSALASEVIWNAIHDAAARKPVVVSMGRLAASGGYYISTPATRIFAQPDTLTGSIGVVGGKIVLGAGLERLGIHVEAFARGKRALLFSPMRGFSDDERAAVRALMEHTYATFKARVAEGRKMSAAVVEKNAQGRIFTGAEAKKRGLVDDLGSLEDALASARQAAHLPDDAPVEVYPGEPTLLEMLSGMTGAHAGLETALTALLPADGALASVALPVRSSLKILSHFEGDPVRVVAFLPFLR